ncbi:unnamed protein product [Ectocarpus fasciculatus]
MPATSVTISGASRTRAFSATWPPYTPASIGVEDDRQSGPYCQVEIRTLPVRTSGAALSRSSEAASDQGEGGDLVFLERELLLRSYNSVSLSDDGTFSLTLSDCHGFMPISTSSPARQISSASRPSHSHDEGAAGRHESPTAEIVRLLFLPLPLSVEFEVNSGQATSSGAIIGNFHLLPIAHTPQLQHPPAFNAETTTTSPGTSTVGRADYTPGFPVLHEPSCTQFTSATATADSLCDRGEMVCTGEGPGVGGRTAPSSLGGCFVAGAAVGVVLCLLLALVIGRRGWAKDVLEHMWTLLKGEGGDAGMRKAGWRSFIFSVGGAKKVSSCQFCTCLRK